MPELPEVETTLRGIAPYLEGRNVARLVIRQRKLRWVIPAGVEELIEGQTIVRLQRRGKYILIIFPVGCLIIHLGMSGSMRVLLHDEPPGRHDHFDLVNESGQIVRFRDPRKFGCLLYTADNPLDHPRLSALGIEPLSEEFNGEFLYARAAKKNIPVKLFLMDGRIAVGVGNIYASEALFLSALNPLRRCSRISLSRYNQLACSVQQVLQRAIEKGGTTLQDFVGADGSPGYFEQELAVYGRQGQPCLRCGNTIRKVVTGQRSTFYCVSCQT